MKLLCLTIFFLVSTNFYSQTDTVRTYYPNGKLESQIVYEKNIRQGEATFFWENGNLKEKRNYINDKVSGTVTSYYQNGKVKEQFSLEEGKRSGITTYYDSTDGNGKDVVFEDGIRKGQDFLLVGEYREEDYQKLLAEWKKRQLQKGNKQSELSLPPLIEEDKKILDDDPAYFINADVMPEPIGGMNTIYKKLIYPPEAKKNNIEGTVKVLAFIEKNGEVSSAKVVEGIGYGCDENARLSVYYTRFKPGLQKGQPVKVQMIIPIEFKLDKTVN